MFPVWFVTSKLIKSLDDALIAYDDILFFDEDSNNVIFFGGDMGILSVDLDEINLDDVNFDEDDPETIINVGIMAWRKRFKKHKLCKKNISKELMPVAWHPIKWRNCACQKLRKKEYK